MSDAAVQKQWCVYILRCGDGTLYTGITNDLDARTAAHNVGKGAKYTARRAPVRVVYSEPAQGRSEASKREYVVKQLSRVEKIALIKGEHGV